MTKVKLEYISPIEIAVQAMRTCYSSNNLSDNLGDRDKNLLIQAVKTGHHTPLEFITFSFSIENMTRLVLQELSRHRTQVLNVQSTRYTIKKMKSDIRNNLSKYFYTDLPHYEEYLITIIDFIDKNNLWELPNDKLKAYFPETLYCKLYMNINLRNYFNFYKLRSSDKAHYLIRELADETYKVLPDFIKELINIYMERNDKNA